MFDILLTKSLMITLDDHSPVLEAESRLHVIVHLAFIHDDKETDTEKP